MYRIRVFNKDGTLGGFFSENGIVKDPSAAKVYSKDYEYKEDISRAFKLSGGIYYPQLTYGLSSLVVSEEQAANYDNFKNTFTGTVKSHSVDINKTTPVLPPYEDLPSRGEEQQSIPFSYFEYNGGNLDEAQEIDIDGGVA